MPTIEGHAEWQITDAEGEIVAQGETGNVVTAVGEQMYLGRGSGASGAAPAPLGMKLGTGATTPARTGAGSTLAAYLANSHQGFDSGFPTITTITGATRVTYKATFGPGKATTTSPITEAVIVNANLTNANSTAANTVSRVRLMGVASKAAAHTLTVTWTHDLMGG